MGSFTFQREDWLGEDHRSQFTEDDDRQFSTLNTARKTPTSQLQIPKPKARNHTGNRQSVIQCSFAQPRKTRSCLKGDSELSVGGLGCFRRVVTRRWSGTRMAVNEVLVHPDLARLSSLRANVRLDSARQSEYTIHVCASSSRPTSHITSGLT